MANQNASQLKYQHLFTLTHDQCLQSSRPWDIDFLLHDHAFDFILESEPLFHCWVIAILAIKLQK